MSYDLFFCREKGKPPLPFDEVVRWSERYPQFSRPAPTRLWYGNEQTGVYFALDSGEADPEEPVIPAGWDDVQLAFNLNFNRPAFFGHEAMPVTADLIARFDLLAMDGNVETPTRFTCEQLIELWKGQNDRAVGALREMGGVPMPHMPRAKGLQLWRYMRDQQELQERLGEGIFVPRYFVMKLNGQLQARTGFVWTLTIPIVVPETDVIFIGHKVRGKFRFARLESSAVLSLAGDCLEPLDGAPGLRLLPEKHVARAAKLLKTVESKWEEKDYEVLAFDGFVDSEAIT